MRECKALVDLGTEYCIIPKVDAYALGYPEAANDDPVTPGDNTLTFSSHEGFGKAGLISMAEVGVGALSFTNVEFLAFDLPQATTFDIVIGRSLLQSTRLQIDYSTELLRIEKAGTGGAGS